MTRWIIPLALGLLSACASDPKAMVLADVNLSDMRTLQIVGQQLSPNERALLATYVVRHRPGSTRYCGRPVLMKDGHTPKTIGDLLEISRAMEIADRKTEEEARRPRTDQELRALRWSKLTDEKDLLLDRQSMTKMRGGPTDKARMDWHSGALRIAAINRELTLLKRKRRVAVR